MRRQIVTKLTTLFFLFLASVPAAAHAALQRVAPTVPAYGYPGWYQDSTGLTLDFCAPQHQAELDGGWCLILPADVPSGTAPEIFPTDFAEEHFYWAGNSLLNLTSGRASLVLGLEAAFGTGPVAAGDQVTFGRIRVSIPSLPEDGTYIIYHPYGVWTFPGQLAGDRLFFTEDIGFNCAPGQFDCALASNLGPFLVPSTVAGGPELPPVVLPETGRKYIADPARDGPVTGSPLPPFTSGVDGVTRSHNIFRIELLRPGAAAPVLLASSENFTLMGRIFEGSIPSRVHVDRASYTVPVWSSPTAGKLDVFATAFPALNSRLPGGTSPASVPPRLYFWDDPCAVDPVTGAIVGPPPLEPAHQMFAAGSSYWGQSPPCDLDPVTGAVIVPVSICVASNAIDVNGAQVLAYYSAPVLDEVTVTEALYDVGSTGLSVQATSSDLVDPPTLLLTDFGELVNGVFTTNQKPPPATVQVTSTARRPLAFGNKGGVGELQVSTGLGVIAAPPVPIAASDLATTLEDAGVSTIAVLANDTYNGAPLVYGPGVTVSIVAAPRMGTAAVNLLDGTIAYTPNPNASGADGFAYTVSIAQPDGSVVVSNVGGVSVMITAVNDVPVANADTAAGIANFSVAINVLANDVDPDGAADLAGVVNLTQPTPATASVTAAGGVVTFTASAAGVYTFTYQAVDVAGAISALPATVTVTVAATETIAIARAEFRGDKGRWIVSGTDTPAANQVLSIRYADGPNVGFQVGTAPVDGLGNWAFDVAGLSGLYNPSLAQATGIVVTGPAGGNATAGVLIR